ncbi:MULTISPECIES: hypothetical protein [unclassified Mesorhizobium]|uniref:hypothetical protein n=1 Tax=unclassified Mesorhizobium TaxID=325217 RepID=UPI0024172070|nr:MULTISPECIES: hypothetical protein [unclassified Mesorhizobium]MDG4901409.1 hypothetical protein [Mesorhizobium sp. WSM4962]MDG4918897.1 hypothetical protein [Mesorhizobium sp. WSM4989]
MNWPRRGVYFFFEDGERRSDSGTGPRVVRVGTHALKPESKSKLWGRLSQHRGGGSGGGNHRGSIFRLIVGTALVSQEPQLAVSTWDVGNTADRATRDGEHALESRVSEVIRAMPFLWLGIDDEPGAESLRGAIERNAIALLSNYEREPLDRASKGWLGHHCDRSRVCASGLWNWRHVNERHDPAFLDTLEALIEAEGAV